ncbi:SMP-30/gluconolactonase/LRE family protein [Lewinella sp. W8]|uniref:SMP-30/gluconolactonase/LRE family protein n=1 Tax=Lewinella sp. W8 TaxID=2528208 RepID=UPI00106763C3|nr:SMP-30/gluconolactonase/LRE family protein [Lewinella sp. W8]MTB51849.1 SMP-30/gluconolactonase/LRE family protein [Lewinella sp. W8]
MRKIVLTLLGLLVVLFLYLLLTPAPIDPVALEFPREELGDNGALSTLTVSFTEYCSGCEDIDLSANKRWLYTGHEDGRILRFDLKDSGPTVVIDSFPSRPIGMDLVGDTLLYVCVERDGLAVIDLRNGGHRILVSEYDGKAFQLTDDVDLAPDGRIYFTDASDKYGDEDLQLDLLEGRGNGAFYRYEPRTGKTERLIDDLHFANGVAVSPDGSFALVNETGAFRTLRYWISGPKAGSHDIFIEGLSGWPDGISLGSDGNFYLTLISPRTGLHDFILPRPWTRRLTTKLPRSWWPKPVKGNQILALSDGGEMLQFWTDLSPEFSGISSVERKGDSLLLGTLNDVGVGFHVLD